MKLSTSQLNGFLQNPPSAVRVILVYGPDTGLVSERLELLASKSVSDKNDPFSVSLLTGAQIGAEPSRLFDEAAAMSLMGGRRLVRVQQATEACAATLATFLKDPPQTDSMVLIEGGDLDKRSKLRALCEGGNTFSRGHSLLSGRCSGKAKNDCMHVTGRKTVSLS